MISTGTVVCAFGLALLSLAEAGRGGYNYGSELFRPQQPSYNYGNYYGNSYPSNYYARSGYPSGSYNYNNYYRQQYPSTYGNGYQNSYYGNAYGNGYGNAYATPAAYNSMGINYDQNGNSYIGTPKNGLYIFCNGRGCPGRG